MVLCNAFGLSCRVMVLARNNVLRSMHLEKKRFLSVSHALLKERLYTEKHEWVLVDGETGTVGISSYAQEALGDIVFAQLPTVGQSLKQHEECGALESVKAASELYSPISGSVVEKNDAVENTPSLVNTSCYEDGWLFRVKITKRDELTSLMDEKTYEQYLQKADH
ncbi:glycine cleavage system H protein, mitochondrial [Bradysia coprophila]|uniref:glycine cleavage system H protein, mitochondrial n=1 Tax=Bradysia coprophila TaxID=38358 RepID=UPI00187D79C0|nr:glycine cleavage system H protein, mitochondrial [Bradysia coprophila]